MRLPEATNNSVVSALSDYSSEAGPSCLSLDKPGSSNGHTKGTNFALMSNGSNGVPSTNGNGIQKHSSSITRVSLPGTSLYDDSFVDREEFVRLVIQSLRDVGYIESAATLEAESGYSLESSDVSNFRNYILEASWSSAEALLIQLGVADKESLWTAKFLIGQQKYLELLEARKTTAALQVLRNELAPLDVDSEELHFLSSLIMCSDSEDLRQRARWDGASGQSRRHLLSNLQLYIPASIMIPDRRFSTLLTQSRQYQRQQCIYHNSPTNSMSFSLFVDHQCDKEAFPRVTTTILDMHTDEVWNIVWSHSGNFLASAGKDKTAIIWRIGLETEPSSRECAAEFVLKDHPYSVGCLAWSLDDSILLTSADHLILFWNAKTGNRIRSLESHVETVSALVWLPDGSGFISSSLDHKIISWDCDGKQLEIWNNVHMRVTDIAVSPDFKRLVTIGMGYKSPLASDASQPIASGANGIATNPRRGTGNRMITYNMDTKDIEMSIPMEGELTSVKISDDSRYALINHAPDEIQLWNLEAGRMERKFMGQRQVHHVIRSCFGGIDGNFVVSGSEDRNVYVWHRDSGVLLEVLSGHGMGSVNSVAWNPRNERMFASCSDDNTIRIWEAPPSDMTEALLEEFEPDLSSSSSGKGKGKIRNWDGQVDGMV
ncbi:WD40 repeat-like protein [Hygrophoropsis aurantiaca]|uniref:WD40 repeat-like protein n=1 Tax=Hygrophoropsis aurantiaca TaxID=72124 RepID=A0ACB8ACE3_9AGAM|nr:WD40 repeat-like protein [Hygrophoropsis aurantiaca]